MVRKRLNSKVDQVLNFTDLALFAQKYRFLCTPTPIFFYEHLIDLLPTHKTRDELYEAYLEGFDLLYEMVEDRASFTAVVALFCCQVGLYKNKEDHDCIDPPPSPVFPYRKLPQKMLAFANFSIEQKLKLYPLFAELNKGEKVSTTVWISLFVKSLQLKLFSLEQLILILKYRAKPEQALEEELRPFFSDHILSALASNTELNLFKLIEHGNLDYLKDLLNMGISPNQEFKGDTLLSCLLRYNDIQLDKIEFLIEAGADVNQYLSGSQVLPLDLAYIISNHELIFLLKSKGGKRGMPEDEKGILAFQILESGNIVRIKELLNSGFSPNYIHKGETPLSFLMQQEPINYAIIQLLIEYGANINSLIPSTLTFPLETADALNVPALIDLLSQQGAKRRTEKNHELYRLNKAHGKTEKVPLRNRMENILTYTFQQCIPPKLWEASELLKEFTQFGVTTDLTGTYLRMEAQINKIEYKEGVFWELWKDGRPQLVGINLHTGKKSYFISYGDYTTIHLFDAIIYPTLKVEILKVHPNLEALNAMKREDFFN